jgi:CO/xanthine dehydrogenase FAD-binding subunit
MNEGYRGFDIIGPKTLEELAAGIKGYDGRISFLAGGTDLTIDLRKGRKKPNLVVDLSQIKELGGVYEQKSLLRIGSMTSFSRLAEEPSVLKHARCLAQAAVKIGSEQIRNKGTIGGNIASASPAGDSLPGLLVLDAHVTTLSPEGSRNIPMPQLLTGKGMTCLGPQELITEIEIPVRNEPFLSGFEKIGSRTAVTIARLNMAAALDYDRSSKIIKNVRIAVGALGETAFRLTAVEQALEGQAVKQSLLRLWETMMVDAVDQAIEGRNSHPYKREAVKGLVQNMVMGLDINT